LYCFLINVFLEDALVEKYRELIVTSHEESCLWRKRGCDGQYPFISKL